jgi:hypothetical protein
MSSDSDGHTILGSAVLEYPTYKLPLTYAVIMPAVGFKPTNTCYNPGLGPNPPKDSSCPAMMDATCPPF